MRSGIDIPTYPDFLSAYGHVMLMLALFGQIFRVVSKAVLSGNIHCGTSIGGFQRNKHPHAAVFWAKVPVFCSHKTAFFSRGRHLQTQWRMTWSPATPEGQHVLTSADLSRLHWKAPLSRQQYFACCWPCHFVHLSVYETPNVQSLNFTCNQMKLQVFSCRLFWCLRRTSFPQTRL